MYHVGGNFFLRRTTEGAIREEMGAVYWETDEGPVPKCIAFVRNVVMLFLALYRVFKSMEPLPF